MRRKNPIGLGRAAVAAWLLSAIPLLTDLALAQRGQRQEAAVRAAPALSSSTYLGGNGFDYAYAIAVDSSGNVYIAGQTNSPNFPATGPILGPGGGTCGAPTDTAPCVHVFVAKLNPAGTALVFATIIGGSNQDHATGIAVDSAGAAYVTGFTASTDFPTLGAFEPTSAGGNCGSATVPVPCFHAFVAKLDPSGAHLVYSTYLGGSGNDLAAGIAVDSSGAAYIAGSTSSANFPVTTGGVQTALGGGASNAFVTKLDPTGSRAVYSTYLGGAGEDHGAAIAVDASGSAYVAGYTNSNNFPTVNPFQGRLASGACGSIQCFDAFVTKLNPAGSALVYSTYFGGSGGDYGYGIAVDQAGSAYFTGLTTSTDFPLTPGALQTVGGGTRYSSFVVKLNPDGSAPTFSTYLGGTANVAGYAIALDALGNSYVTGLVYGSGFTTASPVQPAWDFLNDAFVAKVNAAGSAVIFATYLGGSGNDVGQGITVDSSGNACLTGGTFSVDFPATPGAFQTAFGGGAYNAFVTKISGLTLPVLSLDETSIVFPAQDVNTTSPPETLKVANSGDSTLELSSITGSANFAVADDCGGTLAPAADCTLSVSFTPTALGPSSGTITISDNAWGDPHTISLAGTGIGSPAEAVVSLSPQSLNFGGQNIQTTGPSQNVVLTNFGASTLLIAEISVTGDFAEDGTCGATLAAGASCTLSVTFHPTATGARTGTLTIADNAAGSPQTVALAGMGTAPGVALSAASLNFGNQGLGTSSPPQLVHLTSSGSGPLAVASVAGTGDFTETNNCSASIAPGSGCDISIVFAPSSSGARSGTLTIADNAAGSPQVAPLAGAGVVAFSLATNPSAQTVVKGADSAAFQVSASSAFGFTGAIALSCSGSAPANCNFIPASVAPGQSSALTVTGLATLAANSLTFTIIGTSGPQSASISLSVLLSDYTLTAASPSASIVAGQSAVYSLKLSPTNGFSQSVSLSCSGAPLEATCSVSPGAISLDGAHDSTATVTVNTTARSSVRSPRRAPPAAPDCDGPPAWGRLILPFLVVAAFFAAAGRKRKFRLAQCAASLCLSLFLASCGGGSSGGAPSGPAGTPAGAYTLNVTASSPGTPSHNVSLTLVVD